LKIIAYNPQKARLETTEAALTEQNTTWFEHCINENDIYTITDLEGGLLIKEHGYRYPTLIYDICRADLDYDERKAKRRLKKIMALYK